MTRASRRGAALATGAVAGLAIATLVLPQLANTLKPTALGVALLTLVLGLLTLATQRFREFYRRRSELESALLAYPPELLGSADPVALGVCAPMPGPKSKVESASSEELLDRALTGSRYLVVKGPSGCGKSKAAADCASRVLPTVAGVVPFNAEGLGTLQAEEFALGVDHCDDGVCLWLDDLDRFLEVLDTRALNPRERSSATALARSLTHRDRRLTRLVATIRSDRWDDTRKGSDDPSQTLRRLESMATLVTLDEAGRVVDVQPELEPTHAGATDEQVARPAPPMRSDRQPANPPRAKPLWRDVLFVSLAIATAAVGIALAILYGVDRKVLVQPPPVSDQIASITSAMQSELGHGHVVFSERVSLHSTEEPSWIIGVQHGPVQSLHHGAVQSDDLRIYDVHNGWLERKLDFQPTAAGPNPPHLQQVADNSATAGVFNNNGAPEFIAGYNVLSRASPTILPFGIDWETGVGGSGYILRGLTEFRDFKEDPGPAFSLAHLDHSQAAFLESNYGRPITLRNRQLDPSNPWLRAYPVSAFALARQPSGRLLLGYLLRRYDYTRTNDLEFEVGQIRSGGVATHPCSSTNPTCSGPRRPEEIHVPPDKGDSQALEEEWPHLRSKWVQKIKETDL